MQADPNRIRQILLNLILNAIQAQVGGGQVVVHILTDGLSVTDAGPGVPEHLRDNLFEPFASERQAALDWDCTSPRAIAEAHGGELAYAVGPGGGARFVLGGLAPVVDDEPASPAVSREVTDE